MELRSHGAIRFLFTCLQRSVGADVQGVHRYLQSITKDAVTSLTSFVVIIPSRYGLNITQGPKYELPTFRLHLWIPQSV
jgi:hypothetical protein